MTAQYGYGPNGRALKKDGTERKERRTLSAEETLAQLAETEARAYAGIGRKVLTASEGMTEFNNGLAIFKKWVSECNGLASHEKREEKRANLQAQIDALDSKGEVAEEFLPTAASAIEAINGLHARVGRSYQGLIKDGNATPESISDMIRSEISDDVLEIVEGANNPASDPLAEYRKAAVEDDSEDDDAL